MIYDYLIILIFLTLSALFSGLTLGLMGLNTFELQRKVKLGSKNAQKVYPLRKRGNQLLCTLLIGNVAVNSALAVFLGSITQGVLAGLIATALIVIFGEIIPQSLFSRHALKLGAKAMPIVYFFHVIFYPITLPLSKILDRVLGGELPTIYSKNELKLLLEDHNESSHSKLDSDELRILKGGLEYSDMTVQEVMTPRINTFFLKSTAILNKRTLKRIQKIGHSRIPVFDSNRDKVVGILYSKDLIPIDPDDQEPVPKIMRKNTHFIKDSDPLDSVLNRFKKEKVHLFIVTNKFGGMAGIITLEDVLEEIVGEIVDEFDTHVDMRVMDSF
jgi:metal transporter CNNM